MLSFAKKLDTITLAIDIRTETRIAMPKLEKPKLFLPTTNEVIWSINPLMTILNSPNVINVIGNERMINTGLMAAFRNANTKLANNAIHTLAT